MNIRIQKYFKNTLMSKMFLNYLILTLIPFVFFSSLFINILYKSKYQDIIENNKRIINNARVSFDERILSVQNLLLQLSRTKNVIASINSNGHNTPAEFYAEAKCMDTLATIITANPICYDIFLFTPDTESILASSYKIFKNSTMNYSSLNRLDMEQIFPVIEEQSKNLGLSYSYFKDIDGNPILFISLSGRNSSNKIISLIAIINRNELLNILDYSKKTSGMEAAILSEKGEVLGISKDLSSKSSSYWSGFILNETSDVGTIKLKNGDTLTYATSKIFPVKFISFIPAKILSVVSANLVTLLVFMVILLVLDCFLLNYIVAKNIYKPVNSVLKLASNSTINDTTFNGNSDINFIGTTLKTSMEKTITLEKYINNCLPQLREKFLLELISESAVDVSTITEQMTALKIQLPHTWFSVHIIHINNFNLYKKTHGKNQAQYAIMKLLEEVKKIKISDTVFLRLKNGNNIIVLCNISNEFETEKFEDLCHQNYLNINIEFYSEFGLDCCISVGKYVNSIASVHQSYISASETLKNSFISTDENTFFMYRQNDVNKNQEPIYQYPCCDEDYIKDMLICGRVTEAVERMRSVVQMNLCYNTNYEYIELLFTQLLATSVRTLYESGYTVENVYGKEYDIFKEVKLYDKADDKMGFIENVYTRIGSFMQSNMEKSTITTYDLEKYISENYNKNIGLSDAADYFRLSAPYFSKIFKNKMNCLFVDYLCQYRVREALKLIKDNKNKTLKEIGYDVGFLNYKTFARSFYKVTSLTPEQYRSSAN